MRLLPAAAFFFIRRATRAFVLGPHRLPAQTQLVLTPLVAHRRPALFPASQRTRPSRARGRSTNHTGSHGAVVSRAPASGHRAGIRRVGARPRRFTTGPSRSFEPEAGVGVTSQPAQARVQIGRAHV
jgi:hypothetical protein